ncbi:MAG: hypothetical protein QOD28_434 [Acidobacteriota bacterium]|nr:hypothetical protein [Acidobacteriota bacterium]
MPWISLAATRETYRRMVAELRDEPGYAESQMRVVTSNDARNALLAGDGEWADVEGRRCRALLERKRKEWRPPPEETMWKVFGLAVAASLVGDDPASVIEAIAKSRSYRDAEDKSLQLVARRIAGLEESPQKPYAEPGHVGTEAEWFKLVKRAPAAHALDLSLTPDHHLWPVLTKFTLPLAYLVAQERARPDRAADLKLLMSMGAHPERRGDIIYEREDERPDFKNDATPAERNRWKGFDALEIKDGELFVYYYLGIRWKAPLIFQEDLDTFEFLARVPKDWRALEKSVTQTQLAKLKEAREHGRCTYVLVYDSYESETSEGDLLAAAAHYKLKLEARDLTEV